MNDLQPRATFDAAVLSAPPAHVAPLPPAAQLGSALRGISVLSIALIVVFIGGFIVWASFTPLASAAVATGTVGSEGSRRIVQHLEGGIVSKIMVHEGDEVRANQLLVKIDPTQARTIFDARKDKWLRLLATRARLEAHDLALNEPKFPPELTGGEDKEVRRNVEDQRQLFTVRKRAQDEKRSILEQQISQIKEESRGKALLTESLRDQVALIERELKDKEYLLSKNLIRRSEVFALQRTAASLRGQIAANLTDIAKLEQKSDETRLQIANTVSQFRDQNSEQLAKATEDLAQAVEQLTAARDTLGRTDVLAPVAGVVINLRQKTEGGVVRPGDPIMDIVPTEEALVIDARLLPADIDSVRVGQESRLYLTPFNSRDFPPLIGIVQKIGADIITDTQNPNVKYYDVRIAVPRTEIAKLGSDAVLTSGMQAEVFVLLRSRTFIAYLLDPVTRSFRRAFKEK